MKKILFIVCGTLLLTGCGHRESGFSAEGCYEGRKVIVVGTVIKYSDQADVRAVVGERSATITKEPCTVKP